MPSETAIKCHGGKAYLAKKIVALMPRHTHYVEPYFGGGSVLFAKDPECVSEVINDLHTGVYVFWRVMRDQEMFQKFKQIVELTPFSRMEFDAAVEGWPLDQPEAAAQFFIRNRQSRQGLGKDFATLSRNRTRRGMNEQVSSWLSAIDGLPWFHSRLRRVVIENMEALRLIEREDTPNTLFYCDPPYMHETRFSKDEYDHEMSGHDHGCLLATLSEIKGKFLLSGYRSKLYDTFASEYGWRRVDFDLPNNASSKKEKERKTECVWMNFQEAATAA